MKSITKKVAVILTLSVSLILSSCTSGLSGEMKKEDRLLKDFSGIDLAVAAEVYLTQASDYSFSIEADKSILDRIITEVSGKNLVIKTERGFSQNWSNTKIKIYITMPEIENLLVSGSGSILATSTINANALTMRVTGSGDITLEDLVVTSIVANVSGSGDVNLSGKGSAKDASIRIIGSCDVTVKGIEFADADVNITGSGDAYIFVASNLVARIVGSGDIRYGGNPIVDGKITGSGELRNK